jgi:uncharacterized protein Usg
MKASSWTRALIESEAPVSSIPIRAGDFEGQLSGKRLTTAEVLYYMPDHPGLLQTFLWQTLDEAPDYPRIQRFLDFWRREIDAVIHSVAITSQPQVAPARARTARFYDKLN